MECLHRFCQGCIEKNLRLARQKECPECRVKVSSRRALRADPAFDKIIQTFYPDRHAYEKKEMQFILCVNTDSQRVAVLVEEGLRRQVRIVQTSKAHLRVSDRGTGCVSRRRKRNMSAFATAIA